MDTTTPAPRPAPALGKVLRKVLLRNVGAFAVAVAAWLLSGLAGPATVVAVPSGLERPSHAERVVERLVTGHDCWTDEAPAGAVPGHAVVTLPGTDHRARPHVVPADVGFGIWLDGDPGTLHAFCP